MLNINQISFFNNKTIAPEKLMPVAEKIVLGSAVCIVEGLATSLAFLLPKGLGFYYGGCLMLLALCLIMAQFKNSRLGADLCDLYVYELGLFVLATAVVLAGNKSTLLWYVFNLVAFLRYIRVYAVNDSTTTQAGWSLGFFAYFYNQKNPLPHSENIIRKRVGAILIAIGLACIATLALQTMKDEHRMYVPWFFAIGYVAINGPLLLRSLAIALQKLFTNGKREAADEAEKAKMREIIAAMKTTHNLSDERATLLLAAFFGTHERKRDHMVELAQLLAHHHPAPLSDKP
jgi:hypothetical protein